MMAEYGQVYREYRDSLLIKEQTSKRSVFAVGISNFKNWCLSNVS